MRLATIRDGAGSLAVVARDEVGVAILDRRTEEPYGDIGELLRAEGPNLAAARDALASGRGGPALGDCEFLRPVREPAGVFCVGLNYRSHLEEVGRELPEAPIWFDKLPRSLADPGAELVISARDLTFDYEGELAVVIGRAGREIAPAEAWDFVAGVTLLNDTGDRAIQRERKQVFLGKNLEASTPFGPFLTTLDEAGRFEDLRFTLAVNGEVRQRGHASDLIFDVPALIADLSKTLTLQPGDVIATGTPSGIGMRFSPPRWLRDGDLIELRSEAVGTLVNTVVEAVRERG